MKDKDKVNFQAVDSKVLIQLIASGEIVSMHKTSARTLIHLGKAVECTPQVQKTAGACEPPSECDSVAMDSSQDADGDEEHGKTYQAPPAKKSKTVSAAIESMKGRA